jgi:hypothetical protein
MRQGDKSTQRVPRTDVDEKHGDNFGIYRACPESAHDFPLRLQLRDSEISAKVLKTNTGDAKSNLASSREISARNSQSAPQLSGRTKHYIMSW